MQRRIWLHLATAAFVGIAAVACGGGAEGPGSDAGPIRLGFSAWPGWFPWQVAEEEELFEKAGIEVELTWFESYLDSLNALAGGRLDANSQTLNDTISSVAGGAKQTIVLVNDNSTGNDQIIVTSEIGSISDLKGKKLAAEQGTVDHYLLLLGLREAGLSQDDITFQPLETSAAAAAFASGQLDGVGVFAPFTTQALKRAGSHALFTSKDHPGAIPDHLVVGDGFLSERSSDVQKLVDVWFETLDWIEDNRDAAVAIMAKRAGVSVEEYTGYDEGTSIFSVAQNLEAFTPGSTVTHLDHAAPQIADFLLEAKLIDAEPDLSDLLDDRFVQAAGNRAE